MVAFLSFRRDFRPPVDAAKITQAKRRCPSLIIMDGEDLTRYREASEAIFRSAIELLPACIMSDMIARTSLGLGSGCARDLQPPLLWP